MFKPFKSVWNKVSALWQRRKPGTALHETILHTAENDLLRRGGPVDDIRDHLSQAPEEIPLRRHQLKTAVQHSLNSAIKKHGDVNVEDRHHLAEKLETICLERAGISHMQPPQSTPNAFHEASTYPRQEPVRQGSVPLNDYPDPFRRPITPVWYSPRGQGSGNAIPPEHYYPSNNVSDDIYMDSHSHEGSTNSRRRPRTNAKLRGRIARQPDTSESSFSEYGLDPGRIRSTPKSPPPGWHRPLPDDDDSPAGYTIIDTVGVRIERGEDSDSLGDFQEPTVLATMYPIPGGVVFAYVAA